MSCRSAAISTLLAALVCVLVSACARSGGHTLPADPEPTGGTSDYSDPKAPKAITSTVITAFSCRISLLSLDLMDDPLLTEPYYALRAERQDGQVQCTRETPEESISFTEDTAFLEDLRSIVTQYDLAQFNGHSRETHGLPDDFGVSLRIDYDSGESIYAADNQNMFLPLGAVRDLVLLFHGETEDPQEAELLAFLSGVWKSDFSSGLRVEIRGSELTRLQDGVPVLRTAFTVAPEEGRLVLTLADTALRETEDSDPYATVTACWLEGGALILVDNAPDTGESWAALYPVEDGLLDGTTAPDDTLPPQPEGT